MLSSTSVLEGSLSCLLITAFRKSDMKAVSHHYSALFLGVPNMATVEESFPRGGTRKTHKSEKVFQQPVEQDNLFSVSDVLVWQDSLNTLSLVFF